LWGGHVVAGGCRTDQHHAGAGVPGAQLAGPVRVVGEKEVLDRVRLTPPPPIEVADQPAIDPRLVRGCAGPPGRLVEDNRHGCDGAGGAPFTSNASSSM